MIFYSQDGDYGEYCCKLKRSFELEVGAYLHVLLTDVLTRSEREFIIAIIIILFLMSF